MDVTYLLIILCYLVLMIYLMMKGKTKRKAGKLMQLLNVTLDPGQYVEEVTVIIKGGVDKRTATILNNNLATAYGQLGEYDKAIKIYKEVLSEPKFNYHGVVNGQLTQMYLAKKDVPAAQKSWQVFKRALSPKHEKSLERYVRSIEGHFALLDGEYEQSLATHLDLLSSVQAKGEEVHLRYRLAETYEKLGQRDEQKEQLAFVAEHGNKLHIANLARQQLQEM